nr:hypothetical protein ABAZ39_08725 [Azospirillum argentinense]
MDFYYLRLQALQDIFHPLHALQQSFHTGIMGASPAKFNATPPAGIRAPSLNLLFDAMKKTLVVPIIISSRHLTSPSPQPRLSGLLGHQQFRFPVSAFLRHEKGATWTGGGGPTGCDGCILFSVSSASDIAADSAACAAERLSAAALFISASFSAN